MLVIEIPAVYASVARANHGGQALAALGICIAILVMVNTPALALTPLVVTEQGYHPQPRLWRYALTVGPPPPPSGSPGPGRWPGLG